MILVIKANAYGHGMEMVARQAFAAGVRRYLVARVDEALDLRGVLPEGEIFLLGGVWPRDVETLVTHRVVPVLVSEVQAVEMAEYARRNGITLPCHVKIDTGMGRLGVPWEAAAETLVRLRKAGGLRVEGICTHFASAARLDDRFDEIQAERFLGVERECREKGMKGLFRHVSNSAAYLSHPEWDMDGVRLGLVAYGYGDPKTALRVRTRPVLHWKTRVIQVKKVGAGVPVGYDGAYVTTHPTWLATLDAGYADGYPRLMSNRGQVLIGGRRAAVAGKVTMSFTVVDVGEAGGVKEGDEVVLMGRQGDAELWAEELAQWGETIPYEILTGIRLHSSKARRPCP